MKETLTVEPQKNYSFSLKPEIIHEYFEAIGLIDKAVMRTACTDVSCGVISEFTNWLEF